MRRSWRGAQYPGVHAHDYLAEKMAALAVH